MYKIQFYAFTKFDRPGLHIWDKRHTAAHTRLVEAHRIDSPSGGYWWRFDINLPDAKTVNFKLFNWNEPGTNESVWEDLERVLPVKVGEDFPEQVWFVEGSSRVILQNPFSQPGKQRVKIHCITKQKYKDGKIYIWTPQNENKTPRTLMGCSTPEDSGCLFDFELDEDFGNVFNFVFIQPDGTYEKNTVNRTWVVTDGDEIWTHSEGPDILTSRPLKKDLKIHFRHELGSISLFMYIWQDGHGFQEYEEATPGPAPGWLSFQRTGDKNLYTGITYGIMFTTQKESSNGNDWEDNDARRFLVLGDNETYWTLEGDSKLFTAKPELNQPVVVDIAAQSPLNKLGEIHSLEIKVNKAKAALPKGGERRPDGSWQFWTYPGVVTSFKFSGGQDKEKDYHRIASPESVPNPRPEIKVHVVLDRPPILFEKPPADLFQNPPFLIRRPGVVVDETNQKLEFSFHAPWCARVRIWGDWLPAGSEPIDLKSTEDGTFWWLELPVNEFRKGLSEEYENDYHGVRYHYILNEITHDKVHNELNGGKIVQDPAADWVETSNVEGFSKLVNHQRYHWKSTNWRTPGWEYLLVYQLHPSRFSNRYPELTPLERITREVESGYLKDLGVTAILLMPVSEFQGSNSWGYAPSYFYAVEESYGGPNKLKELVDVCHQNDIAVLLDVVFNHLGCGDNIIWATCRDTFVKGDTEWGPLPYFKNDQCKYFFTQNLVHWVRQYHMDGFRFDQTRPIIDGGHYAPFIRQPGDGGGWEFLHTLRQAVKSIEPQTLFMAEELPNDPAVTNTGGPMDTQWCDDFHDRIVELSRGSGDKIGQFAEAQKYSQTVFQQWYNVTNYSESHDEVGNVNDRIANVGGFGQGLRRNKVAATATLLSRGIPMFFMGEEFGETAQFVQNSDQTLDLNVCNDDCDKKRMLNWWKEMIKLRKNNPKIQGPAPINIHYAQDQILAFSRGEGQDFFIVCNFSPQTTSRNLGAMNLPDGVYKELWNSTWPAFQVEWEDELHNGRQEARLHRGYDLNIPDYGTVILEKV